MGAHDKRLFRHVHPHPTWRQSLSPMAGGFRQRSMHSPAFWNSGTGAHKKTPPAAGGGGGSGLDRDRTHAGREGFDLSKKNPAGLPAGRVLSREKRVSYFAGSFGLPATKLPLPSGLPATGVPPRAVCPATKLPLPSGLPATKLPVPCGPVF